MKQIILAILVTASIAVVVDAYSKWSNAGANYVELNVKSEEVTQIVAQIMPDISSYLLFKCSPLVTPKKINAAKKLVTDAGSNYLLQIQVKLLFSSCPLDSYEKTCSASGFVAAGNSESFELYGWSCS